MTKSNKLKKVSKKEPSIPLYRKKLLEEQAIRNSQKYYNTSKFVNPVGNPYTWDVEKENVFEGDICDLFGIKFEPKEIMTILPEILK